LNDNAVIEGSGKFQMKSEITNRIAHLLAESTEASVTHQRQD